MGIDVSRWLSAFALEELHLVGDAQRFPGPSVNRQECFFFKIDYDFLVL